MCVKVAPECASAQQHTASSTAMTMIYNDYNKAIINLSKNMTMSDDCRFE